MQENKGVSDIFHRIYIQGILGDACLLWRPHPLLESAFNSMRPMYKPFYDALRDEFIRENIGIYDCRGRTIGGERL